MTGFDKKFLHPKFWPNWFGLLLMRLSVFLPTLLKQIIAKLLTILMSPFMGSRRKVARRNLELCFPELSEQQRKELLAKNMQNLGMMPLEVAMSWWASDERLNKLVDFHGLEHLRDAEASSRGIIFLTAHFTCMELGGRLGALHTKAHVMVRHFKNPLFNAVMLGARARHGDGVIMRNDIRSMVKVLKKGGKVWYAPDQDFGRKDSIYTEFFGQKAATITATSRLVKMTDAIILPFVPRRLEDGRYSITFEPAWQGFPSGDDVADAQRINDWVEAQIRQVPDQYFWVHRRFKSQPDGKAKLYD